MCRTLREILSLVLRKSPLLSVSIARGWGWLSTIGVYTGARFDRVFGPP